MPTTGQWKYFVLGFIMGTKEGRQCWIAEGGSKNMLNPSPIPSKISARMGGSSYPQFTWMVSALKKYCASLKSQPENTKGGRICRAKSTSDFQDTARSTVALWTYSQNAHLRWVAEGKRAKKAAPRKTEDLFNERPAPSILR